MKESFRRHTLSLVMVGGIGLGIAAHAKAEQNANLPPLSSTSSALIMENKPITPVSVDDPSPVRTSDSRNYCRKDIELEVELEWPVDGTFNQGCSEKHYSSIDIGIPYDTKVKAAAEGNVTFVGGDPCCGLGYYVIIDHGKGVETTYGHLRGFATTNGSHVEKGEVIGRSGSTGNSTGPHLHFDLRKFIDSRIEFLDPKAYLP